MKLLTTATLIGALSLVMIASPAFAGKKPKGSKSPGASVIKQKYIGKTWKWTKGGIYFAKNGTTIAVWEKSVGIGKWSVSSSGKICNKAVWHWKEKNKIKKKKIQACWKHALAKDGVLWSHDKKKNNWYEASFNKMSNGNRINSKANALKRKIGM